MRSGPFRLTATHRGLTAGAGAGGFSWSTRGRRKTGKRRAKLGTRIMCVILGLGLLAVFWPVGVLFLLAAIFG